MYLFQPSDLIVIIHLILIYIPLCIYFNPIRKAAAKKPSRFTFHYVSISTSFVSAGETVLSTFTFHYVSISTVQMLAWCPCNIHLHSTMYLFQPNALHTSAKQNIFTFHYVSISTNEALKNIIAYEEFTFHYVSISTRLRVRNCRRTMRIYIPLCIYFNA